MEQTLTIILGSQPTFYVPQNTIYSSSATFVIPVGQTLPSSVRKSDGFYKNRISDLLHHTSEDGTASRSLLSSVSNPLSRSSLLISDPEPYQKDKRHSLTKPKMCTPLIPHKSYRSVRPLQQPVNTTARYHHEPGGVSE